MSSSLMTYTNFNSAQELWLPVVSDCIAVPAAIAGEPSGECELQVPEQAERPGIGNVFHIAKERDADAVADCAINPSDKAPGVVATPAHSRKDDAAVNLKRGATQNKRAVRPLRVRRRAIHGRVSVTLGDQVTWNQQTFHRHFFLYHGFLPRLDRRCPRLSA